MTTRRIDECLSRRDGHLYVEECSAVDLAGRFGTPIFVVSEDQLRRNVRRFHTAFQTRWPEGQVKLLPAAKASWSTAVQRILADEGCGCDIYSSGELSVALKAGVDPADISVNGVPKDEAHIRRAVAAGARITIDSSEEVDVIERAAKEAGVVAKVRLRLKPPLSDFTDHTEFVAEGLVPTDVAAMAYKGGLSPDQIMKIAPRIMRMDSLELVGFHEHNGRHKASTDYWEAQMRAFAREIGRVCRALGGYQPREIDIGGGFAIPRDPFNAATNYSDPIRLAALYLLSKGLGILGSRRRYQVMARIIDTLSEQPNQTAAPSIEEYAEACTSTLRRELAANGVETRGLVLQLEPGRAMHGNTGIHLSTVTNIKTSREPIRWKIVVVDTTEFWFTGGRYEHHLHDYVFANRVNDEPVGRADIVGRSCYGDRLMPTVPIPDVAVGDLLALLDTGAYQEVSMSNFNAMPRPATVLVTGDRAEVIRRAETEEDVFARDQIPDHLALAEPRRRVGRG